MQPFLCNAFLIRFPFIIVARWHQMAGFIFVVMGSVKGLLSNGHQAITVTNSYHM